MHHLAPIAQYLVSVAAAVGCAATFAMRAPQPQEIPHLGRAELQQTYLDCARISSASLLEPDLLTVCSAVADALLHRHFDGDLERQLQWWQSARSGESASPAAAAAESLEAPGPVDHAR